MRYKEYEFNEGLDGVVVAKSLNQAINILRKNGYWHYTKHEIRKSVEINDLFAGSDFTVDISPTRKQRSRMLGWRE